MSQLVFSENWAGSSVDTSKWTVSVGTPVVSGNSISTYFGLSGSGKQSFSGKNLVCEFSNLNGQADSDLSIVFTDVKGANTIGFYCNENYYNQGLRIDFGGVFGSGYTNAGGNVSGTKYYRITFSGTTIKIEQGSSYGNYTASLTRTASVSTDSYNFYMTVNTARSVDYFYPITVYADKRLALDAQTTSAFSTDTSWTHTVGPGDDRNLVIMCTQPNGDYLTGVTVDGVAATLYNKYTPYWGYYTYYVANLSVGAHTIRMTATYNSMAIARSFTGADTSSPFNANSGNFTSSATSIATTLAVANNDSAVLALYGSAWGAANVSLSGLTSAQITALQSNYMKAAYDSPLLRNAGNLTLTASSSYQHMHVYGVALSSYIDPPPAATGKTFLLF